MKKLNKYILLLLALVVCMPACKDEDLEIIPEWQSAVHGEGVISSTADNFIKGDPSVDLTFDLYWNSIDGDNTVTKIDIYALFNEAYIDLEGNPKTAKHGGDQGLLLTTLEGAAVPANRETTSFTVSQADLYALYSDATFDYYGEGALPVWGTGSIRADRNTTNNFFVDGDSFQVKWVFTTADGRVFDSWGISVCTEFPGANCSVAWAAVCSQIIEEPAGDWVISMVDTYGDGWQGGYVSVIVDGAEIAQATIPDYWETGEGPYSALVETVTVPASATSLTFAWSSDTYNGECEFSIISPKGNVVAKGANPAAGTLILDLCKENE